MTETLVHTVAFPHLHLEQVVDQVDCWGDRMSDIKNVFACDVSRQFKPQAAGFSLQVSFSVFN